MKSTMFIVGLFLVAATALRLKQRDCNAPRDAIASCEDMCKVTERDLQIKTNHIQSLSIVTKKDQKVIKSFDQCLAKYVKHHVEEQQNSPKTEIFVRSVALKNAYESVEVLDKAVHEKLQILERVSESKQKIYTMRSNIKKFHDCFSSIDNLAVCKSKLAQEVAALSLRHAKLREYRSQSMADVETETRKEIDSTKRNIDDWTLELATLAQNSSSSSRRPCARGVVMNSCLLAGLGLLVPLDLSTAFGIKVNGKILLTTPTTCTMAKKSSLRITRGDISGPMMGLTT